MRIVYVEDNAANFLLVRKVLEVRGEHDVEQAPSAEIGWERIVADPPRLVLLDLDLPGMSGLELARRLHHINDLTYTLRYGLVLVACGVGARHTSPPEPWTTSASPS